MGAPSGQVLGYDVLRRLVSWASDGSGSPASTGQYAYDGEGSRVWQQVTNTVGSTTTTTSIEYLPDGDEVATRWRREPLDVSALIDLLRLLAQKS